MMIEILRAKPKDIPRHLVKYLEKTYEERATSVTNAAIDELRSEVKRLEAKLEQRILDKKNYLKEE
jgi:hypothetical protein